MGIHRRVCDTVLTLFSHCSHTVLACNLIDPSPLHRLFSLRELPLLTGSRIASPYYGAQSSTCARTISRFRPDAASRYKHGFSCVP